MTATTEPEPTLDESGWTEFVPARQHRRGGLHVTLLEKGTLMIGSTCFAALGSPGYVTLHLDQGRSRIAIRASGNLPNALKVAEDHAVSVRSFTKWAGIRIEKTTRFSATVEGDTIIVDLNEEQP